MIRLFIRLVGLMVGAMLHAAYWGVIMLAWFVRDVLLRGAMAAALLLRDGWAEARAARGADHALENRDLLPAAGAALCQRPGRLAQLRTEWQDR